MKLRATDLHSNETNNSCKRKYSKVKVGSLTRVTWLSMLFSAKLTSAIVKNMFHYLNWPHEHQIFFLPNKLIHFDIRILKVSDFKSIQALL